MTSFVERRRNAARLWYRLGVCSTLLYVRAGGTVWRGLDALNLIENGGQ
jgi:hypothetical protein